MTDLNDLEDFIQNRREAFDRESPSAQLWENLEKDLPRIGKGRLLRYSYRVWMRVAAGIVLLLGLGWTLFRLSLGTGDQYPGESPQLVQAQVYYRREIIRSLATLDRIPPSRLALPRGTRELLALETPDFTQLNVDLHTNPGDQRVQAAMIQYYRDKLDLIRRIEDRYHKIKTEKSP